MTTEDNFSSLARRVAKLEAALQPLGNPAKCKWTSPHDGGLLRAGCDNEEMWPKSFTEMFKYCPHCGKEIEL